MAFAPSLALPEPYRQEACLLRRDSKVSCQHVKGSGVPESNELADHNLGVLISVLNRVVDDAVMAVLAAEHPDVRRAHGPVFEMLDPGGSRVADLARRARMSRQAMGELVDDLERLGYVERRPDPRDGRAKLVMLTEKGEAAAAQGIAAGG